ncbi:MAG TPA: phage minor head protein [Solimonas sp.]
MATANSRLLDALVRHSIYLQRYGGGVANKVVALLNRADLDMVRQIEARYGKIEGKGFDSGPAVTKRLQALLAEVRQLNHAAYEAIGKDLDGELRKFAEYEAGWLLGTLSDLLPNGISVTAPAPRTVTAAAMSRPFQGRLLKEWLSGLESAKAARVRDAIRLGMVEGETVQQMVRRIRGTRALGYADGLLEIDRRGAAAMVRTAVNHVGSAAREALALDNEDILKGERWTSVLDARTTAICRARDGEVFPVGKGPKPPAHIGCRSVRTPVLQDDFGFLSEGRTRASQDGPVSGQETYQSWLKRQPAAFQDEVLGNAKGALFRRGGLTLDRFVSRSGDELTLDQLKVKEPDAFARAGLAA